MALFESYERRIDKINAVLAQYGIKSIEEAKAICDEKGIDPYKMCEETQPICFENAKWAYVVGAAIAIKKGCTNAADAAEAIGEGLQAFCINGSVAEDRKVGIGHGNLAARLLREETQCFAFLAGHESFAAAEGAIKIAEMANRVRKNPLRVILNGLGKGLRSQVGTMFGTNAKGTRYLEMAEGYCTRMALDANDEVIGYEFVHLGKMMDFIKKGIEPAEALEKAKGSYGRFNDAVKYIDPRHE